MSQVALDTSAAIPLVVRSHIAHAVVTEALGRRVPCLTGHTAVEAYSVLTRLPGDSRLLPDDAVRLLADRFEATFLVPAATAKALPATLARAGVSGGAVYDAVVALAARAASVPLLTRDRRAAATYRRVEIAYELIAG